MRKYALPLLGLVVALAAALWWFQGEKEDPGSRGGVQDAAATQLTGPVTGGDGSGLDFPPELKASISGRIVGQDGAPVPGAKACARNEDSTRTSSGALVEVPCADADAEGHYQLDGLNPSAVVVWGQAPGHRARYHVREVVRGTRKLSVPLSPGASVPNLDITLIAGAHKISGVVEDLAGGVVSGAQVRASGSFTSSKSLLDAQAFVLSGDDGSFAIWAASGSARVSATAEGYATRSKDALAPSENFRLRLTPESALEGQVIDAETNKPVAGVTVSVQGRFASKGPKSDVEGRFRIGGLSPGRYSLKASGPSHFGEHSDVALNFGATAQVTVMLFPATSVSGVVFFSDKAAEPGAPRVPCEEARVNLRRSENDPTLRALADAEGRVKIDGLLPGDYKVDVNCPGALTPDDKLVLTVGTEPPPEQQWPVQAGNKLRGKVVDTQGNPVSGVRVMFRPSSGQSVFGGGASKAVDNPDGSWELNGLLAGSGTLRVSRGFRPTSFEPLELTLPEQGELEPVEVVLQAYGSVRGRVVSPHGGAVAGATVRAQTSDGKSGSALTDAEGTFEIVELEPGDYRVGASQNGAQLRAPGASDDDLRGELVTVSSGEPSEVELLVGANAGAIRGRIVDHAGAPVPDAFVSATRQSDRAGVRRASARRRARSQWGEWRREPQLSEADGSFVLEGLAEGIYTVRSYHKEGGDAVAEDVPLGADVELRIPATAAIGGRLEVSGRPAPERFTIALVDEAQGIRQSSDFFRQANDFHIDGLVAGTYTLTLSSSAGDATIEGLALTEGEQRHDLVLELEAQIRVRGRLVDDQTRKPLPGLKVQISTTGGFSMGDSDRKDDPDVSDKDGRFVVASAPTGRVTMNLMPTDFTKSLYGFTSIPVNLSDASDEVDLGDVELVSSGLTMSDVRGDLGISFEDDAPDTKLADQKSVVASVRPGGPAAKAGIQPGDEIVAVGSRDIRGKNRWKRRAMLVKVGSKVQLTLSDQRTLTLTAVAAP